MFRLLIHYEPLSVPKFHVKNEPSITLYTFTTTFTNHLFLFTYYTTLSSIGILSFQKLTLFLFS